MYELVVASGKGGTGKTSLVGAFAELAGSAVLVDCDVDAANLHLIVPHQVLEQHDFSSSSRAAIDMDRCVACALCMDSCRFDAISMMEDSETRWRTRFEVDPSACEGCGLCARLCQAQAIDLKKVISGEWFLSHWEGGPFLHARLGIAQSNSGRLVTMLRQQARKVAEEGGHDLVIIDGPPGIGCPVIASLTDASYLLVVTEPSVSAIHDMERLADLAEHFRVRTGVCINKCDISEEISLRLEDVAARRGLTIHGCIPYDPAFTKAQVQGHSYVRIASAESVGRIEEIWQSIVSDSGYQDHTGTHRFAI